MIIHTDVLVFTIKSYIGAKLLNELVVSAVLMPVEVLLLCGMFYAMEFFMGNSNVCIIIYY